jgi:O-antigen ligase
MKVAEETAGPDIRTEWIDEENRRGGRGAARKSSAVVFWGAVSLLPLTAVPYGAVEPWWKAVFQCLVFLLTAVWLCDVALFSGMRRLKSLHLLLPFALLILYALLQTVSWGTTTEPLIVPQVGRTISADPAATRGFVLQFTAVVLAGWLLFQYTTNEKRLRLLAHAVLVVALASAVFGLCRQSMQGESGGFLLPALRSGEGYGQFINRNHFAYLMELAMGLAAGLLLATRLRLGARLVYLAAFIFMGATIVFCNSRGGILSMISQLLLVCAFFDVARRRRHKTSEPKKGSRASRSIVRTALALCLLLMLAVGVTWVGGDRLVSRVNETVNAGADETHTNASRYDIWRATLRLIKAHPLTGAGFGGYWIAVAQYNDASGRLAPQEAHNDYLELLASGGLLGLASAGWITFVLARQVHRCLQASYGLRRAISFGALAGLFAVGVHSLFDFGLHVPVNALTFAALIVLAGREVPEQKKSGIPPRER